MEDQLEAQDGLLDVKVVDGIVLEWLYALTQFGFWGRKDQWHVLQQEDDEVEQWQREVNHGYYAEGVFETEHSVERSVRLVCGLCKQQNITHVDEDQSGHQKDLHVLAEETQYAEPAETAVEVELVLINQREQGGRVNYRLQFQLHRHKVDFLDELLLFVGVGKTFWTNNEVARMQLSF